SFKPTYEALIEAVHPDDRYEMQLMHFRAQETKKSYNADHRIILQDGTIRYVHCETELKLDADGEVMAMVGTVQDVTELREKELELKRSRELLRRFAQTHDNIREQECKRIAREIHDELGQQLTALRLDIALSVTQFGSENPDLYKRLQEMKRAVDTTIHTVRSIASSLRPAPLNMGLPSAIDWLVEQLQSRCDLSVELDLKAVPKNLPEEIANSLFRIIQESLTNIARHANAQNVWIIFAKSEDQLILEIRDNGQGFDEAQVKQNSSGLLGIVERASLMNGSANVESKLGEGTKIEVSIPLNFEVN
ncbi:MAG TPA: histidine kinase, partial [Pseudomonadales bacterium]|nr:histidine kinase [Pseudomonadales bacterium]